MKAGAHYGKYLILLLLLLAFAVPLLTSCSTKTSTTQTPAPNAASPEIKLLCWVGYDEPDFLEAFEKKHHITVKTQTYVGGDEMFNLLTKSKGEYDLVIMDPEYIKKLQIAGRLQVLNPEEFSFDDYLEPLQQFPLCWIDGKLYAVFVRYGIDGIAYNTEHLTADDVKSYSILWDPKVKGRVGVWDWYLPNMGCISRYLGNEKTPYAIGDKEFAQLKKKLLALKPQVGSLDREPDALIAALADGKVWVVPTAGEWVAGTLMLQGKPVDWVVPKEGGVMWTETIGIPNDAPHTQLAKTFILWIQTPEAQELLSRRSAYFANCANFKAYELMTPQMKDALKVHNKEEALSLLSRVCMRQLPQNQPEKKWQDAWQAFKDAK